MPHPKLATLPIGHLQSQFSTELEFLFHFPCAVLWGPVRTQCSKSTIVSAIPSECNSPFPSWYSSLLWSSESSRVFGHSQHLFLPVPHRGSTTLLLSFNPIHATHNIINGDDTIHNCPKCSSRSCAMRRHRWRYLPHPHHQYQRLFVKYTL